MRRFSLLAALVGVSLVLIAPAAEAQTQPFEARFKQKVRHNDPFCATGIFCGTGTVEGYGEATITVNPTSIGPGPGAPCFQSITAVATVTLSDGSGTLTIDAAGVLCQPGNTAFAPPLHSAGLLKTFGSPFTVSIIYEVIGGTGVLAGASGEGTATRPSAGAMTQLDASGVLEP